MQERGKGSRNIDLCVSEKKILLRLPKHLTKEHRLLKLGDSFQSELKQVNCDFILVYPSASVEVKRKESKC